MHGFPTTYISATLNDDMAANPNIEHLFTHTDEKGRRWEIVFEDDSNGNRVWAAYPDVETASYGMHCLTSVEGTAELIAVLPRW